MSESTPGPASRFFETSPQYEQARAEDLRFAAIHERALLGQPVSRADFLYLQAHVSQEPNNLYHPSFLLICNILEEALYRIRQDFIHFYGLSPLEVTASAALCLLWGIVHTTPNILDASETIGLDWGSHLMELIRQLMWMHLLGGYKPTKHLDDAAFRLMFEQRWPELLQFRGPKFDFRVVPTFSPEDFVRYQKLPHGDKDIRAMISSYIVHQATAYPHLLEPVVPDLIRGVYRARMREMYTPLVRKVVARILAGLGGTRGEAKRIKADVTQQAWDAYDEAVKKFVFHVPYAGGKPRWGLLGILGLAESARERESFDAFLRTGAAEQLGLAGPGEQVQSTDFTPIVFAHFLNERLETWWRKAYPPVPREAPLESLDRPAYGGTEGPSLGETLTHEEPVTDEEPVTNGKTVTGASGWQVDSSAIPHEKPALISSDGISYLTIKQVMRQQGASMMQVRYLETAGLYMPKRAGEVSGACPRFGKKIRLYPDTPEAYAEIAAALARTATRSTALTGQEMTRKVAATYLNVASSKLRSLERRGELCPVRRGQSVVYTAECLSQARQLLQNK